MSETDDVTRWLHSMSQHSSQAMEAIWQAYFEQLAQFAKGRLAQAPRRAADEEDIALSAMMSFYKGAKAKRFPKLDDRHDLWKILLTITARKVQKRVRHQTAQKRGGGRERGESAFTASHSESDRAGIGEVLGNEPTPEFAASIAEEFQTLLTALDDPTLKEIALLKFQAFSNEEIAEQQQCAVRTIERKLRVIRSKWQFMN